MANNQQQFSFEATFPSRAIRDEVLAHFLARDRAEDQCPAGTGSVQLHGIDARAQDDGTTASIWFSDKAGSPDLDGFAEFLHEELKRLDLGVIIGFEWAVTCSRPMTGQFGGGAVAISRAQIRWLNTGTWLSAALDELAKPG